MAESRQAVRCQPELADAHLALGEALAAIGEHAEALSHLQQAQSLAPTDPRPPAALARLRGLYESIAKIPAFAGFCYTQLTDVEQEVNGLLTYDRKPKYDVRLVKEINLPSESSSSTM